MKRCIMSKQAFDKIEIARIIIAKNMGIPPDDIDMSAIFACAQRSIEEKVENNLDEYILNPVNKEEMNAIVGPIGEKVIPMMFNNEYPFDDYVEKYENWYKKKLISELLKIKLKSFLYNKEQ